MYNEQLKEEIRKLIRDWVKAGQYAEAKGAEQVLKIIEDVDQQEREEFEACHAPTEDPFHEGDLPY